MLSQLARQLPKVLVLAAMCLVLLTLLMLPLTRLDYNADMLYLPAFFNDILLTHTNISGWMLPSVPGFIPDAPLFLLAYLVSRFQLTVAFPVYGILFYTCLILSLVYVYSRFAKITYASILVLLASNMAWLAAVLIAPYGPELLRLFCVHTHGGLLVPALVLLGMWLSMGWPKQRPRLLVPWLFLSILAAASDPFFLIQFLLPLLLTNMVASVILGAPKLAGLSLTLSAGVVLGTSLFWQAVRRITHAHFAFEHFPTIALQITRIGDVINNTGRAFLPVMRQNWRVAIMSGGTFLLAIVLAAVLRKRAAAETAGASEGTSTLWFMSTFVAASMACTLVIPMLCNLLIYPSQIRYLEPLYVWTGIYVPIVLTRLVLNTDSRPRRRAVVPALTVLFLSLGVGVCWLRREASPRVPPDYFAELMEFTARYHVKAGVGGYWKAKPISLFSHGDVQVNQVDFNLDLFHHIDNLWWFFRRGSGNEVTFRNHEFAILDEYTMTYDACVRRFGLPAVEYKGRSVHIVLYDRKEDVAFRNFWRSHVATWLKHDLGPAFVQPAVLRKWKPDGFSPEGEGVVRIAKAEPLELRLERPAHGDVLEILANCDDRYIVKVESSDGNVGELTMGPVPGPGLQRRFMLIPEKLAAAGVAKLVVIPVECSGGQSAVGHVFLYEDCFSQGE